jgi:Uma2 family endonuclease
MGVYTLPLAVEQLSGGGGEIIEMAPVGGLHGKIALQVALRLAHYVKRHGAGEVVVGDVGFVLALPEDPERVRAPDVAFISTERLPEGGLPQGFFDGAPDLAVEVLSPNDPPGDVRQEVRDYLDAGAQLVWEVAPRADRPGSAGTSTNRPGAEA